jgi:hypothetical protein
VTRTDIQRRVYLRRRKHGFYTKNKRGGIRYAILWVTVLKIRLLALQTIPFTFADLSAWYNGYNSGAGERLYIPWSIAMALQRKRLDRYWAESGKYFLSLFCPFSYKFMIGYDEVLLEQFHTFLNDDHKFRKQIEQLLMDEPVSIELDHGMTYHSFRRISPSIKWMLT